MGADDATLLARAAQGDRWAEDAQYRRYAPMITRVCSRVLTRSDADDVVQDTFVLAFRKLPLCAMPDARALRAWLARIALRQARRVLRKQRLLRLFGASQSPSKPRLHLLAHLRPTRPASHTHRVRRGAPQPLLGVRYTWM